MITDYVVAVDGLSALRDLETIPEDVRRVAAMAINKTADRARAQASRRIREQVAFPARYLSDGNKRLDVSRRAKPEDLEAVITGRFRATSLARFVTSGAVGSRKGVRVQVAPGMARYMRRAFLIPLRAGTAPIETKSNLGLAIRLRPGETIQNKKKVLKLGSNIYLLYGPSVSQVFRTVADEEAPETAAFLEAEFLRLMELNP